MQETERAREKLRHARFMFVQVETSVFPGDLPLKNRMKTFAYGMHSITEGLDLLVEAVHDVYVKVEQLSRKSGVQ
jgi:hypothetical protein